MQLKDPVFSFDLTGVNLNSRRSAILDMADREECFPNLSLKPSLGALVTVQNLSHSDYHSIGLQ